MRNSGVISAITRKQWRAEWERHGMESQWIRNLFHISYDARGILINEMWLSAAEWRRRRWWKSWLNSDLGFSSHLPAWFLHDFGSIVSTYLTEWFIAINDGKVDDLSIGQQEWAVSCGWVGKKKTEKVEVCQKNRKTCQTLQHVLCSLSNFHN